MKRYSTDLFPMQTNPFNFQKGDVVKKIYSDKVVTPYVGVVTAVIPSTNKLEVQWPYGMGMEDPWDLLKMNPLIFPPVVNEDKAYKTYQNELSHKYFEKLQPYNVLKNYLEDQVMPVVVSAAALYNSGCNKSDAYIRLSSDFDNRRIIVEALNKVFNDHIEMVKVLHKEKDISVSLAGTSDKGFKIVVKHGHDKEVFNYDNLKIAIKAYHRFSELLERHYKEDEETVYKDLVKAASLKLAAIKQESSEIKKLGGSNSLVKDTIKKNHPEASDLIT